VRAGEGTRVLRTLEDTPFYARSILDARLMGERVAAVHETLDLRRLDTALVRWMLSFRMPRRAA
jgi:carotenoid 1,2-hydratase